MVLVQFSTVANVPPEGGRKHPQQEFIQVNIVGESTFALRLTSYFVDLEGQSKPAAAK